MAKKESSNEELTYLRSKLQEGKVILGTDRILKELKISNKLEKVFLASNCPSETKESINTYAELVNTPVVDLSLNNEEMGVLCKKGFLVSVLGTLK